MGKTCCRSKVQGRDGTQDRTADREGIGPQDRASRRTALRGAMLHGRGARVGWATRLGCPGKWPAQRRRHLRHWRQDYRMSMYSPASTLFMLLTAQNFPHMEQVSL